MEHARQLGERLRTFTVVRIFTSPLRRASQTCELAGFGGGAEVDPDLTEWDYGPFEGKLTSEILAERPRWELYRDGCPGGESPEDVAARADRVITSASFTGERILGAILFEDTMDRDIEGQPTADYLWNVKRVVPFRKVDKGLQPEKDGVQLLKPMPELAALLDKGKTKHIFGTKMRSVIKQANPAGIKNVMRQQFEVAGQIIDIGLVPIVEPEVDIHCPEKAKAEALLKEAILEKLNGLPAGQQVLLKLTLPELADFYVDCVRHPKVVRVVALSGGYTQEEADARLCKNHGVVASFSRALMEGLSVHQTDAEFNATLKASIQRIFDASIT
jgi:fructose-bisphosphate aldolase class I